MASSFAAELANALDNSWPPVRRQSAAPGRGLVADLAVARWPWLLGKRTLAEWVCNRQHRQAAGLRSSRRPQPMHACPGRRRERHFSRRRRHGAGRYRVLETATYLAKWRHSNNLQREEPERFAAHSTMPRFRRAGRLVRPETWDMLQVRAEMGEPALPRCDDASTDKADPRTDWPAKATSS